MVSDGRSVKQWQKLIQLGIHYLFHSVVIAEDLGTEELNSNLFKKCLEELEAKPEETVYISSKPTRGFLFANKAGIITLRMRKGDSRAEEPVQPEAKAKYEIEQLSGIFSILQILERSSKK